MKQLIILILAFLAFYACSSSKKLTETSKSSQLQSSVNEKSQSDFFARIDTTKSSEYEFTYTKIEFYNPAGNGKEYKTKKESDPEEELELDEVDSEPTVPSKPPNGGIKSIEQWTGKKKEESKGETSVSETVQIENDENIVSCDEIDEKSEKAPVPDPKRWKYIFYLAMLGTFVFIYVKRTPIFKSIKKFFNKE